MSVNKYESRNMLSDVIALFNASKERETKENIAKEQVAGQLEATRLGKEYDLQIATARNDLERELTSKNIDANRVLQVMRYMSEEELAEFKNELAKNFSNFNQDLLLDRIKAEFQNNLKLGKFKEDEALRRAISTSIIGLLDPKHLIKGSAAVALGELTANLTDVMFNNLMRNNNASTFNELLGGTNEESSKEGQTTTTLQTYEQQEAASKRRTARPFEGRSRDSRSQGLRR